MTTVLAIVLLLISPLFGLAMPVIILLALVVLAMGKAADNRQAVIAANPDRATTEFGCGVLTVLLIGGGFLLLVFMLASVGGGL